MIHPQHLWGRIRSNGTMRCRRCKTVTFDPDSTDILLPCEAPEDLEDTIDMESIREQWLVS